MGTNLSAGFFTNKPGPLAGAGLADMEQDRIAKLELPGALPPENLSILDGSINPTRAAVIVDTEGGAPADVLTDISTTLSDGTTLHEGMELAIRAKDASRVITVKNSAAVNGILTADGKNVVLGTGWWLVLYLENGSWRQKNVSASVTIPIGGIIAFSGTFGGTGNRFPIPLGGTSPDTNWVLCDGTRTNGLAVPDLRNRMIVGAGSKYPAGSTGGSETHTHSISGTVGATTLSMEQLAMHSHVQSYLKGWGSGDDGYERMHVDWRAGLTYTQNTGSSQPHTHSLAAPTGSGNSLSPYYALAYIIRIT